MKSDIILDSIIYEFQKWGGVNTYWTCLLNNIDLTMHNYSLMISCKKNNLFNQNFDIYNHNSMVEKHFPLVLKRLLIVKFKNLSKKTVFHSSYFRIAKNHLVKNVTTVHDFIPELYWSGPNRIKSSLIKRRAINNSSHIICVSKSTRKDLLRFYPSIKRENVSVIYHGPSLSIFETKEIPEIGGLKKRIKWLTNWLMQPRTLYRRIFATVSSWNFN